MKDKLRTYSIGYSTGLVSIALVLFLIFVSFAATAAPLTITETRITTSGLASNPAIYGDRIAYMVTSDSNPDFWIDVYDLSTKSVIASSDYDNYEKFPDIYGDRLVFNSVNGISVYDLSTKETQYIPSYGSYYPKIHGDTIVWSDNDVHMYDLSTKKETQITNNGSVRSHAIYGNRIIWTDFNRDALPFSDIDIYMYDLSTMKETQIASGIAASNLDIYADKILWVNHHEMSEPGWGPNDDITVYDLFTNSYTSISTNGSTGNPDIYMDKLVWQDNRDGNSNIYMYDLSTNVETQITTSGSAYNPKIYGNRIVWQDSCNGGSDIYMATLSYPTYPAADFSSNITSGVIPLNVAFTDNSTGMPIAWNWNFGDGTANSTVQNPTHTYSIAGNYTVTLTVTNSAGNSTITKPDYITATAEQDDSPTITLTQVTTSGTADNPAIYGNNVVYMKSGNIYMYDLSNSEETQITTSGEAYYPAIYGNRVVYRQSGNIYMYDLSTSKVTQISTRGKACSRSDIYGDRILWQEFNDTEFVHRLIMYDLSTQKETQITENNLFTLNSGFWSYAIYGDKIVYDYFPSDDTGCVDVYDLSTQQTTRIGGAIPNSPDIYGDRIVWVETTWEGDFNAYPEYYYNIHTLNLSTQQETQVSTSGRAQYPAIYNNRIVWEDSRGGQNIYMYGNIYMYDLTSSKETQITASGSANSPDVYGDRIVWVDSNNIFVGTLNYPIAPLANFSCNVSEGSAPLTVQFTDLSENAAEWCWDFGDGVTDSENRNPVHKYVAPRIYTVSLVVSNQNGSDTASAIINVSSPAPQPAPLKINGFTAKITSGKAPLKTEFVSNVTGTNIKKWRWEFETSGKDTYSQHPVTAKHTFTKLGEYDITLTVWDAAGQTATLTKPAYIVVYPAKKVKKPVANFVANVTSGKAPLTVKFTDKSKNNPTYWKWNFGDGTSSTDQNPSYTYKKAGKYTVSLKVKNDAGSSKLTKSGYIVVNKYNLKVKNK